MTVATLGKGKEFPGFFTPSSGFSSPCNIADVKEAAELLAVHNRLNLSGGLLLAVPIPDQFASTGNTVDAAVKQALNESL